MTGLTTQQVGIAVGAGGLIIAWVVMFIIKRIISRLDALERANGIIVTARAEKESVCEHSRPASLEEIDKWCGANTTEQFKTNCLRDGDDILTAMNKRIIELEGTKSEQVRRSTK